MPRTCSICTHPDREEINTVLLTQEPLRAIAARYGTSKNSLARHREHLPVAMVKAEGAHEAARADDLLGQVRDLQDKAHSILDKAEAAGDLRTALMAVKELRGNLELLARLLGELNETTVVNLVMAPEWLAIRGAILVALLPYPEARVAVAAAIGPPHAGQ